jgi:hypothetical protein
LSVRIAKIVKSLQDWSSKGLIGSILIALAASLRGTKSFGTYSFRMVWVLFPSQQFLALPYGFEKCIFCS